MLEKRSPRAVPLAARHLQRFPNVGFDAASWAELSQMDRVGITRAAFAYAWGCWVLPGERERWGVQKRSPPPPPSALALLNKQMNGDFCEGLNLQIPARACSEGFICTHLLYGTDFPYQ